LDKFFIKYTHFEGTQMGLQANGEVSKFPPGDSRLGQTAGPILSLNEAWYHTVDTCVNYGPVSEIILPLMHNCFFGGALHAVLLLQRGRGEQLASDIAGFFGEKPQS
jgi:hypothetical protein